jgi:hypothetical protein
MFHPYHVSLLFHLAGMLAIIDTAACNEQESEYAWKGSLTCILPAGQRA